MKKVELPVSGDKIVGHLFAPEETKVGVATFLFIHGWRSQQDRVDYLAEALTKDGHIVLTFDLRGHGVSGGNLEELSRKDFLDDVLVAYDFLVTIPSVDANNIVVVGSSFGAYLAVLLSAKRKVKALALRVPANYKDEGFTGSHYKTRGIDGGEEWRENVYEYNEVESLKCVHNFEGKVLIVESENDELVPQPVLQSYSNAISNKNNLTYHMMKDAPHSISRHPNFQKEYGDLVLNWIEKNL